jgi:hypothetical protein
MLVCLLPLHFYPEDGGGIFFLNVSEALSEIVVSHPKQY